MADDLHALPPGTGHHANPAGLRSDPALDPLLAGWRDTGRALIGDHWHEFQSLVARAERSITRNRMGDAAADAQVAANYATFFHTGLFTSPRLEHAIARIGQRAIPFAATRPATTGAAQRILHIATELQSIGGHSRNMWRWIEQDRANTHSVALTRQYAPVPDKLARAVAESGGRISHANRGRGGLLEWARRLQKDIAAHDLVVLHVHNFDIIPFVALAGMDHPPPAILLNHADHMFWLGQGFANVVASTRRSGHALCATRRGIEPDRNALLPLCLAPVRPIRTRAAAKDRLGFPPDAVVILTVARATKFRDLGGTCFLDPLLPLLRRNPRLHLAVVGPGGAVDWSAAESEFPDRIKLVAETPETAPYFEAADIYLDSFPFVSITSLLEAGLHGLPVVTRDAFGEGASIFAADSVGLDEGLVRAPSAGSLRETLAALAEDRDRRREVGDRTRAWIEATNCGAGYISEVNALYLQVQSTDRPITAATRRDARPAFEDADLFLPFVFGDPRYDEIPAARIAVATGYVLKVAPMFWKCRKLAVMCLARHHRFLQIDLWRQIVPEWVARALRSRFQGAAQ